MATTTVEQTISAAMELINTKKQNLKKAFDELQSNSGVLSSFNLTWSDLDSHFSAIQTSLNQKLHLLQTLESQSANPNSSEQPQDPPPSCQLPKDPSPLSNSPTQIAKDPSPSSNLPTEIAKHPSSSTSASLATQIANDPEKPTQVPKDLTLSSISPAQIVKDPSSSSNPRTQKDDELDTNLGFDTVPPRPELVALCEKMDAIGLRTYMNETLDNRNTFRGELLVALRSAKDPAAMVLDAMQGFYSKNGKNRGDKDPELFGVRRSSVLLLEVLMKIAPRVGLEVRDRAKKMALEWKGKVGLGGESPFEALGFLHLVAAFGLQSEFSMDDLVDQFVIIARYRQAMELCRKVNLGDKIADLIQKLENKGKHLLAVKFIAEFDLTEKFPPVPILKSYVKESKKLAKKVSKDGHNSRKSLNEATAKESGALKSVLKVIEDLKLESEYSPASLQQRLDQLEREKENRKRTAAAPAVKPLQKNQQTAKQLEKKLKQEQCGNKRPRMTAPVHSTAVSNNVSATGMLPAYVFSGTAPPIAPYAGSSTGLYSFAGGQPGFSANPSPSSTHLYSSEQIVPSGYYGRSTAYGGYGVPPAYHPSHYPQ